MYCGRHDSLNHRVRVVHGVTGLAALLLAVAVSVSVAAAPPGVVSGTVYLDANGNGRRDAGEAPVAGVRVTDGVGIVATDAAGAYTLRIAPDGALPVSGTQTVALCWPSGHWPTSKHWFRLKDIADPARCDFGLRAQEQAVPFTYLHVTDSHDWRASPYENQHENTTTTLREAAFIIQTGDLGWGGATPEDMDRSAARLLGCMARNPMPTFITIGNHDTDCTYGPEHEYSEYGGFVNFFGPLRWSFDYAGIRFVFIDIIEDNPERLAATAAWLEKDLAGRPEGARVILSYHYPTYGDGAFQELLRRHAVELVHAGHSHAYARHRGAPAPMVTAFARSSGTANVLRVDADGTHVGFFCDGCARGAHNYNHSRRCPVAWREHFVEGLLTGRTAATQEAPAQTLDGAAAPISVNAGAVYVTARIQPGPAGRAGVRIGKQGGGAIEVALAGEHLVINGARFPTRIPPADEGVLRLYVFAHKNMLTVWANDVFFFEQEVAFKGAAGVVAFAEGGPANLLSLKVQELRPDPDNRATSYACGCGHGAIMRNPE
jgi:hypothetical protein